MTKWILVEQANDVRATLICFYTFCIVLHAELLL